MSSTFKLVSITMLLCFLTSNIIMARLLETSPTLATRLKLDDEESSSNCFYLSPSGLTGCCRVIKVIEYDCWPTMLGSIGYISKEGNILCGYGSASDSSNVVPTQPSFPPAN
ncbi:hypothetical protein ACJIZ3_018464 [Penstemon smallii]|uniref:Prolamin-like domain-containing protein n=1 Tax=Penstemon smallii TaxID=265156 RepID=A0ABD3SYH4_9LAMI